MLRPTPAPPRILFDQSLSSYDRRSHRAHCSVFDCYGRHCYNVHCSVFDCYDRHCCTAGCSVFDCYDSSYRNKPSSEIPNFTPGARISSKCAPHHMKNGKPLKEYLLLTTLKITQNNTNLQIHVIITYYHISNPTSEKIKLNLKE